MKSSTHLPIYGVGPCYGITVIVTSIAAFILSFIGIFKKGQMENSFLVIFCLLFGLFLSIIGFRLWIPSAFGKSSIDCYVEENKLCTTGTYAYVRNPCYSGITFIFLGFLIMAHNWFLAPLPFFYWIFMTVLLKNTEEKWLLEKYGEEYKNYQKKVNRCIPWFPKKS